MNENFTQIDSDNLSDIIWWIKGYIAGAKDNYEDCPFGDDHVESLRKASLLLKKEWADEKPVKKENINE